MEQRQKAYPRNVQYNSGSLMVCILSAIAGRLGLEKGQTILVGRSDDLIIVKPMEAKLARKDLKIHMVCQMLKKCPRSRPSN